MPGMKITLSAAMRARDVSRPAVPDDHAPPAESEPAARRPARPGGKPARPAAAGRAPAEASSPAEATATTTTGSRPRPEFTAADLEHADTVAAPAAQPPPTRQPAPVAQPAPAAQPPPATQSEPATQSGPATQASPATPGEHGPGRSRRRNRRRSR
jgi:hypothetical protein